MLLCNKSDKNMEQNQEKTTKRQITETSDFSRRLGIIKKIAIFLFLFFTVAIVSLLSLQAVIKLQNVGTNHNKEIADIILSELNKMGVNTDKTQLESSLIIQGELSFRSFLKPHISITNIEGKNLIENQYSVDFRIEKLDLYLSLDYLLGKQFVVNKVDVINGNFTVNQLSRTTEINMVKEIINKYLSKLTEKNSDIKIQLRNNSITVKTFNYTRELDNINILGMSSRSKFSFAGKLNSNRQPLNINIDLHRNKDEFKGTIGLNSQAFNYNTSINANFKELKFFGNSDLDITNLQVFSRTMFNGSDFVYRRIIDNSNLKASFEFNMQNNVLNIKNANFDGNNLKASGEMQFNFMRNQKNTVNLSVDTINVDALIIRNLVSKNTNKMGEKDISIFSSRMVEQEIDSHRGFIESKLKLNPTFFDIKIKNILFNQEEITDVELNFSYFETYKYRFNRVIGNLPAGAHLTIENKNEEQLLSIQGDDIWGFQNFLKKSIGTYSNTVNNEKVKFDFSGTIETNGDRLFINNSTFSMGNLKTENTIEIKFDSGISFIAADIKIDNLSLDEFISQKSDETFPTYINTLKNKMLFLNTFTLNTFLRFNIKNIQYKDFKSSNYIFTMQSSHGLLNIYNINLNNKIGGNISFNILQSQPKLDINLRLNRVHIRNNIDVNRILFNIPTLEDFYGTINIVGTDITFKKSPINQLVISANLKNGIINFNKLEINGFGGKCKVSGFLDIQYNRKLNLTFNGCTANLQDTLYLFTGTDNISGLVGFSSVLYAEGQNIQNFIQSYVMKLQLVASGIDVKKFGLLELNNDLLKINTDEELLNSLDPKQVLYDENSNTIFEKLSNGTVQYSKRNGGQFSFDITRLMINGKANGKFELLPNHLMLQMNSNFVMLGGSLTKTIPLTIAMAINGNTSENLNIVTNFQNIDSYILSIKNKFEELKNKRSQAAAVGSN